MEDMENKIVTEQTWSFYQGVKKEKRIERDNTRIKYRYDQCTWKWKNVWKKKLDVLCIEKIKNMKNNVKNKHEASIKVWRKRKESSEIKQEWKLWREIYMKQRY